MEVVMEAGAVHATMSMWGSWAIVIGLLVISVIIFAGDDDLL